MSSDRSEFRRKQLQRREAKKQGTLHEPPHTSPWVPQGQEWTAYSVWSPRGPYMISDRNTFMSHGGFPTEEAADAHLTLLESKQPQLQYVQGLVVRTGEPVVLPCIPHPEVKRKFKPGQEKISEQWDRMMAQRRYEADELRARVEAAKKVYTLTNEGEAGEHPEETAGGTASEASNADQEASTE